MVVIEPHQASEGDEGFEDDFDDMPPLGPGSSPGNTRHGGAGNRATFPDPFTVAANPRRTPEVFEDLRHVLGSDLGEEENDVRGGARATGSGAASSDDSLPPLVSNTPCEVEPSSDDEPRHLSSREAPIAESGVNLPKDSAGRWARSRMNFPSAHSSPGEDEDQDLEDVPPVVSHVGTRSQKMSPEPAGLGDIDVEDDLPAQSLLGGRAGQSGNDRLPAPTSYPPLPTARGRPKMPDTSPLPAAAEDLDDDRGGGPLETSPKQHLPEELLEAKSRLQGCRRRGDKGQIALALLDHAQAALHHGRLDEALKDSDEAREIFREHLSGKGEAEALRMSVKVHAKAGRSSAAVEQAEDELARFRELGDRRAEGVMHLALADVHVAREDYPLACKHADQALESFEEATDLEGEAKAWETNCAVLHAAERWEKLLKSFDAARAKVDAAGDPSCRAAVLRFAVWAHLRSSAGSAEKAVQLAQEAENLCEENHDARGLALAREALATAIAAAREDYCEAARTVKRSVESWQRLGDKSGELTALNILSSMLLPDDLQEAFHVHRQAVKLAREIEDLMALGDALDIGTSIHQNNDAPQKVLESAREEVQSAQSARSRLRESFCLLRLGKVRFEEGYADDGIQDCEEAARIAREVSSVKWEATAKLNLGEALMHARTEGPKALEAAQDAEGLFRALNDPRGIVQALQVQVSVHLDGGNDELALPLCEKQVSTYREKGYPEEEANAQLGVADVVNDARGPKEAQREAKKARQLYKNMGDSRGEASCLIRAAMYLASGASLAEALQSAKEARLLAQKLDDVAMEAEALQVGAEVLLLQGSLHESVRQSNLAVRVCRDARDERQEAENTKKTAEIYLNVLNTMEENKRPPDPRYLNDSLNIIQASRDAFEQLGDPFGEASALRVMSSLYMVKKDWDKALDSAQTAQQINNRLNDELGVGLSLLCVTKAYIQMGEADEALLAAHEAETVFKGVGDRGDESGWRGLSDCQQLIKEAEQLKRRSPPRRSQSMGRRLGPHNRQAPERRDLNDEPSGGGLAGKWTSGAGPPFLHSGRSRSVPAEDPFSTTASSRSSSSTGRKEAQDPTSDTVPLPKSLNAYKGPQTTSVKENQAWAAELLLQRSKTERSAKLGFARTPERHLGFGSSGDSEEGAPLPVRSVLHPDEDYQHTHPEPRREVDSLD